MKIERNKLIIALLLVFITAGGFYFTRESSSASGLDYFKGKWTVTMRNNPKASFSWTVKEDLGKSWLAGVVERGGQRITNDLWRQNGKKIERSLLPPAVRLFASKARAGTEIK